MHAVIGRALRDAERWGRVPRNVARHGRPAGARALAGDRLDGRRAAPLPRARRRRSPVRALAAGGDDRDAPRRARAADVAGARSRRRRLSVEQQLVPTRGGATFGPPKSARSRRTVALDPETVDALRAAPRAQLLERDFAGDAYDDRDLVFADALGGPIHPQRLTERFAEHRKAAGIPTGTLHILRHTAATLALTAGVPVHIVAARLGDDPKTVLETYAHLLPQSDELAAERIADGAR